MNPDYTFNRQEITCSHCALNQFKTLSGACRRCHQPLVCSYAQERRFLSHAAPATLSAESLAKSIGRTVRSLRKERRLSQERLATVTGTARPSLSRIENGMALPLLNTLNRISAALGVELHELFINKH